MNAKIHDLMTASVVTTQPHVTVDRVRRIFKRNKVSALPIVDSEGHPIGIISVTDLVSDLKPNSRISSVMTERVFTVPQYNDVSVAARIMRKQGIHHLVVTHEKEVVGIISAFDLLELVEDHRWVPKNPGTKGTKAKGKKKSKKAKTE